MPAISFEGLSIEAAVNLILLLILAWGLLRVINSPNPIDWWQFISSRNAAGRDIGDINSVGMIFGIVGSTWVVCWLAFKEVLEWPIFGLWLLFIGAVKSWALWARALIEKRYGQPPPAPPAADTRSAKATMTLEVPREDKPT